ncbi:MAG: branched-chain amino acid ABC transporter permease, partial [Curvibacter sp.]
YSNHWMAIFGIALITVIVFAPTGLAGALSQCLRPRAAKPARRPAPAAH